MKIILIWITFSIYGAVGQPAPPSITAQPTGSASCDEFVDVSVLISACQNFVTQRSSNSGLDYMTVDYALQQPDISKLVIYSEIDIVFISCMQIIGDYQDLQELSGQSSALPSTTSGLAPPTTSSQPAVSTAPPNPTITTPPPVPPTASVQ